MVKNITVRTKVRTEFVDITDEVQKVITETGIKSGICYLYIPHTTAAITINEGADPSVVRDIQATLMRLIPFEGDYYHQEGNSDAHIKSTTIGVSQFVLVEDGKPLLGTWQSIYLCEFDGPRHRRVSVKVIGDD